MRRSTQAELIAASLNERRACGRLRSTTGAADCGANLGGGTAMKNRRMLALAASVFVFGLTTMPSALADCGLTAKLARPASWHPQASGSNLMNTAFVSADYEGASIVGMWHVTFTSQGAGSALPNGTPVDDALVVWHSDKTEIMNSKRPPQDGNFCMGIWEQTGKLCYKLNHFAWFNNNYDPTNPSSLSDIGSPAGPVQYVELVTLSADGNHYTGTFTLDAYDTSGNVTHIVGVLSGTRITMSTKVPDLL
jgi:hypothetical protein